MAGMRNADCLSALNLIVDTCDNGTGTASAHLKVYSGTPPSQCDGTLAGNTVLADLVMSNAAFGNASDTNPGASASAAAITDDSDADATGTATFIRILDRDGTARLQLSVSAAGGGGEVIFNSTSIAQHARVQVTSLAITLPES